MRKLTHILSVGDSTGRQWLFSVAVPQLDKQPEEEAARRHPDDRPLVGEEDGKDPALEREGEWQPY